MAPAATSPFPPATRRDLKKEFTARRTSSRGGMTTSTTSLMSSLNSGVPHMSPEQLRQLDGAVYDDDDDDDDDDHDENIAVVTTLTKQPAAIEPTTTTRARAQRRHSAKEADFKPASIKPVPGPMKAHSSSNFAEEELVESMTLPEVFKETAKAKARDAEAAAAAFAPGAFTGAGGNSSNLKRMKNHNSSSSHNSDESSILLDVSWGSNQYDKAFVGGFDDMLAVSHGRRISDGHGLRASRSAQERHHIALAANSTTGHPANGTNSNSSSSHNNFDKDVSLRSGVSGNSAGMASYLGGGSNRSGSQGNGGGNRRQTSVRHLNEDLDNGNAGDGIIPPVFKTIRRDSKNINQQQVVHVDGGGDGGNISRNLGFRESAAGGGSKKTPTTIQGILRKSSTSMRRRNSNGSQNSSNSGKSGSRFRRASNASTASNNSDTMTGFQVLTASFQSARQSSLRGMGGSSSPPRSSRGFESDGNSNDNCNVKMRPRLSAVSTSQRSGSQGSQRSHNPPSIRMDYQIEDDDPTISPEAQVRPTDTMARVNSLVRVNSGSGDISDTRRDASMRMDDSRRDENGTMDGRNKESEDNQLVAEQGGTAYLKASRSVWAMRIIVVITFVVVSVIVTVLTHTFFRNMEIGVLKHNFIEISTGIVTNTIRSLDDKASSVGAISNMYLGILGATAVGGNNSMLANHPPSVMLSPDSLACETDPALASWPNVTLPGFDGIGSAMLDVSHSRAAVFAPFLWDDMGWEEYAANNALPLVKDVVSNGIREFESSEQFEDLIVDVALAAANDGGENVRHLQEELFSDSQSSSTLRVPAWQVAPADLMQDGIMWDYYSHPPFKAPIDRILRWNQAEQEGTAKQMPGTMHDNGHGQSMSTASGSGPPVAATELIPCDKTLLPLHLNPMPSTPPLMLGGDGQFETDEHTHRSLPSVENDAAGTSGGLCTAIFHPVFDGSNEIKGVVAEVFSWTDIFQDIMTGQGPKEVRLVIKSIPRHPDGNEQPIVATYKVSELDASFLGYGRIVEEHHVASMNSYSYSFGSNEDMTYTFEVHPTDNLCYENGLSDKPMFLSIIAACFFFLSVMVFFVYDYFVNHRQKVVVRSAARSARIVHSLYPQFVRDNLFGGEGNSSTSQKRKEGTPIGPDGPANTNSTQEYDVEDPRIISVSESDRCAGSTRRKGLKSKVSDFVDTPATQLKRFLTHPMPSREYDYNLCTEIGEMEPIAEVFENTTVMLADIEGFTAWCSEREPSQVFRLLETVYREFDIEARKLGVFKVETVGDCYVAVTGLPDPRDDHAIVIAKYAVRCLLKFNVLTKRLEANLGPGTASLGMRFGLHSGPVTAGVLRGEKSRFQLFGDTINVASRMESMGEKNMIQVSQTTADLLNASGKGHWLTPRDSPVSAKGKGSIQTYWLQPNRRRPSMHGSLRMSETGSTTDEASIPTVSLDRALRQSWKCIGIDNDSLVAKERLIRWNAAILESFLLKIVDNRHVHAPADAFLDPFTPSPDDKFLSFSERLSEKIMFPHAAYRDDYYGVSSDIAISSEAQIELLEYVARIASMYRDVPFHNFDHASHVTMSANKLLNRVCTTFEDEEEDIASVAARTFGISADPLAQFVVVFSSLVHDVDHQGVPNAQLVKENDPLATQFENRSVAEKRSITIAWNILMEDRFLELQSLIFVNGEEMTRFKQLLINTVLATDIADKDRSKEGKIRWQKAFHPSPSSYGSIDESTSSKLDDLSLRSLKATLVFEQIMQASDVAHTMQHWETFKKWNIRLYSELSKGYREGRGASDPRENWYGGEIGFFDFYIIPLAKKLKECGVFGSAASEYLDYSLENRRRWEEEGKEIARKMIVEHDATVAKMPPPSEATMDDALAKLRKDVALAESNPQKEEASDSGKIV